MKKLLAIFVACLSITIIGGNCLAKNTGDKPPVIIERSKGQTVFLPAVHKDISYFRDAEQLELVEQRLSTNILIRNADTKNAITITSIQIYDQDGIIVEWENRYGEIVNNLISTPLTLNPLGSWVHGIPSSIPLDPRSVLGRHVVLVIWEADDYVIHPSIASVFGVSLQDGVGWQFNSMTSFDGRIVE